MPELIKYRVFYGHFLFYDTRFSVRNRPQAVANHIKYDLRPVSLEVPFSPALSTFLLNNRLLYCVYLVYSCATFLMISCACAPRKGVGLIYFSVAAGISCTVASERHKKLHWHSRGKYVNLLTLLMSTCVCNVSS